MEFNIEEFLNLNNSMTEKNMEETKMGKHFDCVLQNPPYATTGSDTLHLKFVDKCLDICDKQIAIFPYNFVKKVNNESNNKYKKKFSKYLIEIEEVPSKEFIGTAMPNTAIYNFTNKKINEKISIISLDGNKTTIKSLLDISNFSDYEKEIIEYLEKQGSQDILGDCGRLNNWKRQIKGLNEKDKNNKLLELIEGSLKKVKKYYENHPNSYGLFVNKSNGGMNAMALSNYNGQILKNYNDFINVFINRPISNGYNALMFSSKKSAENCKIALQNSLLRFTLYRLQDDQAMTPRIYKYVPNINWEDDRVKTDEGLLEVCGCPKDKCKEYAEYCKKIIEEVDKK